MIGSLYSGISGLKAHQVKMNVVGNNIANVNTAGFKKSTVNFKEMMAQTVKGARAPQQGMGGTNPIQVGTGVNVASITTNFGDGTQQTTGRVTDLRIDGKGFFLLSDGNAKYYTRAGNFDLDADGSLVANNGMKVQGWKAEINKDGTKTISAGTPISELTVKVGEPLPGKATTQVTYAGNLRQNSGIQNLKMLVNDGTIDELGRPTGNKTEIEIKFSYDDKNEKWYWRAEGNGIKGRGAFKLNDKNEIIQTFPKESEPIQNANGVLVKTAISGQIAFTDARDVNNREIAKAKDNKFITSNEVFDTLGKGHTLSMAYTKIDENVWSWEAGAEGGQEVKNGKGFVTFDALGQVAQNYVYADPNDKATWPSGVSDVYFTDGVVGKDGALSYGNPTAKYSMDKNGIIRYNGPTEKGLEYGQIMNNAFEGAIMFDPAGDGAATPPGNGAALVSIIPNFSRVTQFASDTTVAFEAQNGYSMGELETFRINDNGDIMGYYSNGYKQVLGRVAVAKFFNPSGLEKAGGSLFQGSPNSGEEIIMQPGNGGTGRLVSESLEMSNVDLSEEFTDMIVAQRGFQANSKTITTADQLLQDLINIKR